MIAAGIGFRKDCTTADIIAAISLALRQANLTMRDIDLLCTPAFKRPALEVAAVAETLDRPLAFIDLNALERRDAETLSRSSQVASRFGLSSVAETAALAGAGAASRLYGPRLIFGNATCALAHSELSL